MLPGIQHRTGGRSVSIGRSREDYLEAIYVLQERAGFVRNVDVARHMKLSKASVSNMVAALSSEGYIEKLSGAPWLLTLTDAGRRVAEQTYDRHCFFRELLLRSGVDGETAEREACELEHAISHESFRLLRRLLSSAAYTESCQG